MKIGLYKGNYSIDLSVTERNIATVWIIIIEPPLEGVPIVKAKQSVIKHSEHCTAQRGMVMTLVNCGKCIIVIFYTYLLDSLHNLQMQYSSAEPLC